MVDVVDKLQAGGIPLHPPPQEGSYQKTQEITNVGEDVEKLEPLCAVGGLPVQPLWKTVRWFLRKIKRRFTR